MAIFAPFEGFDFDAWREKLRRNGFTPAQAMKLYDEARRFGHGSCRSEPVQEVDLWWDEIRSKHCDYIKTIETPEDFQQYLKTTASLCGGDTCDQQITIFLQWVEWGNSFRIGGQDMINRLNGCLAHDPTKQPEQWLAWDAMDLKWADVEAAMGYDRINQPKHWKNASSEEAYQQLQRAVEEAGLSGLEWGANGAQNPHFIADLAQNTEHANALLAQNTNFDGEVLGLNRKLLLRLGVDGIRDDGDCSFRNKAGGLYININSRVGWRAVAHEWLHTLDFAMGHSISPETMNMASDMNGSDLSAHWKDMLEYMTGHTYSQKEAEVIKSELNDGFKKRWAGAQIPEGVANTIEEIRVERSLGATNEEQRQTQYQILTQIYSKTKKQADARVYAEIAMTELELLTAHEDVLARGGSIWVEFAKRFEENIIKRHPDLVDDVADYFLQPFEQAAHSFEASFDGGGSFITDEALSLRYPLPSEAAAQKKAWTKFFENIAPWWQEQVKARYQNDIGVLSNRLAETIAKRRSNNEKHSPKEQAPKQA